MGAFLLPAAQEEFMAEDKAASQEGAASPETHEPTIKELMAQMELIKQAQSGSDRKVKELTGALAQAKQANEDLVKERMTEQQKAAYALEQREKAIAEKDAEIRAKENALIRADVISELGIPRGLAVRISGNTRDEMVADAKGLIQEFSAAVTAEVNKRLAGAAPPKPQAASAPSATRLTPEQIDSMTASESASMSPDEFRKKVLGL